jgi:hypothetical protein
MRAILFAGVSMPIDERRIDEALYNEFLRRLEEIYQNQDDAMCCEKVDALIRELQKLAKRLKTWPS